MRTRRIDSLRTVLLSVLVTTVLVLVGCGKKESQYLPNQPPGVELTSGPVENSSESYSVEFFWAGWDEDGVVDHFLWAIDDTSSERAWNSSYLNRGRFPFPATAKGRPDSSRFSAYHTFFVKAIDDDGAASNIAHLSFNSTTIAPYTEIRTPEAALNPWGEYIGVGSAVYVTWEGTDPDGTTGDPVGYYFRLLQVPPELAVDSEAMRRAMADSSQISTYPWIFVPGDSNSVNLTGLVSRGDTEKKLYVFCVRAVDEAGAIEPYFLYGENMIVIQATPGQIGPTFVFGIEGICEFEIVGEWGKEVPSAREGAQRVEVPVGPELKFYWSGTAAAYGGTVTGYRYALDLQNIDDPLEWSPWTADRTSVIYRFRDIDEGSHRFYLQCKDNGGGVSFGILVFSVVKFDFDRAVYFVDDFVNSRQHGYPETIDPTDDQQDAFWEDLLSAAGLIEGADDGFATFDTWNYVDPEKRESYLPLLDELSRYRAVVWLTSTTWGTYTAYHKIVADPAYSNVLASYLTGGGRLWIIGQGTIRYSFFDAFPYPIIVDDPGTWAYDHLHIRNTRVRAAQGDVRRTGITLAKSSAYPLPDLALDTQPGGRFDFAYAYFRGIGNVEALLEPMRVSNVDTLYYYVAVDSTAFPGSGKPCATKWADPALASKLYWFGFPLDWFGVEPSRDVVKIVLRDMLSP